MLKTFSEFGFSAEVLKSLEEMGIQSPTPIQAEALPLLMGEPTDFLGLAATGTGKTAAFSLPLIEKLEPSARGVQALILCPTRELALQVSGQVELMGKYKGIRTVAIYGGAGYSDQIRGLKQGASVVIGTPGRVLDHLQRGTLKLDGITTVILDEADEMISMGFKEDMEAILDAVSNPSRKIWLFSATMSPGVRKVADAFLVNPKSVQVNRDEMLASGVEQIYYVAQENNKPEILCKLIDMADDFYGLVFFQTKSLVIDATDYLRARGYQVESLHGDMSQSERERAMQLFRDRAVNLLMCTDVASRGLDVKDITHVINYSIPRELDSYVHRIGRTARSGKSGLALSLVTPANRVLVRKIEAKTGSRMREGVVPTRKEVASKKIARLLPKFVAQKEYARAMAHVDSSWDHALVGMSPAEIVARFLTMQFADLFTFTSSGTERSKQFLPESRQPVTAPKMTLVLPVKNDEQSAPKPRDDSDHYGLTMPPKPSAHPAPKTGGAGATGGKMKIVLPKDLKARVQKSAKKKDVAGVHTRPEKKARPHFKERQQARDLLAQARERAQKH